MKWGKRIKVKQAEGGKQLLQTVVFIWSDMQQHRNTAACCIYQTALSQLSQYAAPRSDPLWRAHHDTCSCPLSASTIYPASGPLPLSGRTFLYYLRLGSPQQCCQQTWWWCCSWKWLHICVRTRSAAGGSKCSPKDQGRRGVSAHPGVCLSGSQASTCSVGHFIPGPWALWRAWC